MNDKSDFLKIENDSTVLSDFGWNLNWSTPSVGIEKWNIEVGIFTDNIYPDIVCGLDNGTIKIFNNDQLNQTIILENNYTTYISLVDLNFDSQNELITANGNNISIFDHESGINSSISVMENITEMRTYDLLPENTGQQKIEIITGDISGNLTIWQIDPNNLKFQIVATFMFPGDGISGLAIDDFTQTNWPDLAVITEGGNATYFTRDYANMLYKFHSMQFKPGSGIFKINKFKINKVDRALLVIGDSYGNLTIWRWIYGVGFVNDYEVKINSQILSIDSKDLNHDGNDELLVGTRSGNISVWGIS
jgi:hypothetical protein